MQIKWHFSTVHSQILLILLKMTLQHDAKALILIFTLYLCSYILTVTKINDGIGKVESGQDYYYK